MTSSTAARRPLRGLAVLTAFGAMAMSGAAWAQPVFFSWGPAPGYGYLPPAPVYRPVEPRYAPVPAYPDDDYEPIQRPRPLSGAQVRDQLRARGLHVTGAMSRNGRVYVADVRDRAGAQRRVIVDGYYGRVLQSFPPTAVRQPPQPGPRYAGRPVSPDVDADLMPPAPGTGPMVIPGVGAEPQRPRASQPKKKTAPRVATRPPATRTPPAAMPAIPPAASAPASVPPLQDAAPQVPVIPEPAPPPAAALPAPQASPESPPAQAAVPPVTPAQPVSPATTPGAAAAPATGETAPAVETPAAPAAGQAEQPAERPRRRVRFIKPDSPSIANPNVPGGQIVPIPDAAPVVIPPRAAAAKPAAAEPQPETAPANPLPANPTPVAPLE